MKQNKITFSFGENWQDYLKAITPDDIDKAKRDIEEWLGADYVAGKTVLDIGSGSGVHSLAFHLLGAKQVYSFDYDKNSVSATRTLWEKEAKPANWTVAHGSVLDKDYLQSLGGPFDIVYSWGCLHHTGSMWEAIGNSLQLVKPGGKLWLALYAKGPRYPRDLALKQRYNAASDLGKRWMVFQRIVRTMLVRLRYLKNPFAWNEKKERGMNVYHDIIDWLGGLPYEVAGENEMVQFGRKSGFVLERIKADREGNCSIYVFSLPKS